MMRNGSVPARAVARMRVACVAADASLCGACRQFIAGVRLYEKSCSRDLICRVAVAAQCYRAAAGSWTGRGCPVH